MRSEIRTIIHERVEQARTGQNPKVIAKVPSGWVVLGDVQFLEGYCLLLPDPVVSSLNTLSHEQRARYLMDLTFLGDVVEQITGACRINYEILGNSEPALHAHVFPRSLSEPEEVRKAPVWFYDWKAAPQFDFDKHRGIMLKIGKALVEKYAGMGLEVVIETSLLPPKLERTRVQNEAIRFGVDLNLIEENLAHTPLERIQNHQSALELVLELDRAREKLYPKSE